MKIGISYFEELLKSQSREGITIGVEHEFFLVCEKTGAHVSLVQSQAFFEEVQRLSANSKANKTNNFISEIVSLTANKSKLKYEYPPFLFELELAPFKCIEKLGSELEHLFTIIKKAAKRTGTRPLHTPYLAPPESHDSEILHKLDNIHLGLSESRRKIANEKGIQDNETINFPNSVASTQVHIGGINWLANPQMMKNLYSFEPIVYFLSRGELKDHLRDRWYGYLALFSSDLLFGFPEAPLSDFTAIIKYIESQVPSAKSHEEAIKEFNKVRNLLFIKPRTFGTLEFRSSPSQSSPQKIVELAKLRHDQCLLALTGDQKQFNSLPASKNAWLDIINGRRFFDFKDSHLTKSLKKVFSDCYSLRFKETA